jgi:uncharacterized protein YbjT (DUF2867 family)
MAVPWRDDAEVVRADLSDSGSLAAAFEGADVVYYLVHSMGTAKDFGAEEQDAAHNVADATRDAGVRRLVYLGGLHPNGAQLSAHLRSRTKVGEILLASGVETLVLQAGVIVGSGSASFEMIRHLTDRLPVMTTPKWVHNRIQPISVRDVLHYLLEAATADVAESRTWDIGGPDVLEYGEMMQIYADVAGLNRRTIIVVPPLTPAIASWWVGLVTPIPSGLARPLVESLHCDAVMANDDVDAVIPPPAGGLIGYRQSVSLALSELSEGPGEASWSASVSQTTATDPDWAGPVSYTLTRSGWFPGTQDELWKAVDSSTAQQSWQIMLREPGHLLRVQKRHRTGVSWLRMRVAAVVGGGSAYHQRMTFYPRGIPGRVYWYAGLSRRRKAFRAIFRSVMDRAVIG